MAFQQIPVVSLAEWTDPGADRTAFAERLQTVCHEIGFLRLVDHGVDPAFLADYFDAMRAFFDPPNESKARIDKSRSPWFRGWERVGSELTVNRIGPVGHLRPAALELLLPQLPRPHGTPPSRSDAGYLTEGLLAGVRGLIGDSASPCGAARDDPPTGAIAAWRFSHRTNGPFRRANQPWRSPCGCLSDDGSV